MLYVGVWRNPNSLYKSNLTKPLNFTNEQKTVLTTAHHMSAELQVDLYCEGVRRMECDKTTPLVRAMQIGRYSSIEVRVRMSESYLIIRWKIYYVEYTKTNEDPGSYFSAKSVAEFDTLADTIDQVNANKALLPIQVSHCFRRRRYQGI